MGSGWLEALAVFLLFVIVARAVFRLPVWVSAPPRLLVRAWGLFRRLRPEPDASEPERRPLELLVLDARRLGARLQHPARGTSYAKLEGVRYAYDRVLAQLCDALGVAHLLGVLPPGADLDAERARVESALWLAGVRIDEAA